MKFKKEDMIGFWLTHLSMILRNQLDQKMVDFGMTVPQGFVMLILHVEGASSLLQLAKLAHHAHPTVLRTLDGLEELGLIERVVDPDDRRKKIIHLTTAGNKLVPSIKKSLLNVNKQALNGFSKKEYEQMMSFMHRIAHNMDADYLVGEDN